MTYTTESSQTAANRAGSGMRLMLAVPQHIWTQPTGQRGCLLVDFSPSVPEGALGVTPCVDSYDAKALIVAACSLATGPAGESVYVFWTRNEDPLNRFMPSLVKAHTKLIKRIEKLRELGVGGPEPETFVAPKWLTMLDMEDIEHQRRPLKKLRKSERLKRFRKIDIPPPIVILKRFRNLDFRDKVRKRRWPAR